MEGDLTPRLGMTFDSLDEAWKLWVAYAGRTGFGARKYNFTKSKKDGSILSYRYVCCKEGLRRQDKRDGITTNPRPETRTNCKGRMGVALTDRKYKINVFVEEHNHPLQLPETVHMLASQRKLTKVQAHEIELAEESGLQQKASFQWMSRHAGGRANLGYTREDANNYLKSRRQRSMEYGEAGCLLQYFQQQLAENPSFYHAYQMDVEEQITNVFWADARMLIDYAYFGDVVVLDTTYNTNRDHRPLAIFSGLNHYRGSVIFGAALLYDETIESFKWLLKTFLEAHQKKKPLTIFTDQDQAMTRAISEVLSDTKHALCTWHLKQNGIKHLGNLMKHGSRFLTDFTKCMYEYEEEGQFEEAWSQLLSTYDVRENKWLSSVYKIKEKWASCHMKKALTLGMRSTQLSESVNAEVKSCTRAGMDINQFFKNFERVVEDKRYNELKREFESRQNMPRLIVQSSPILRQVSQIYTTPVFDMFQQQWDLFAAAYIKQRNEIDLVYDYVIGMVDEEGEWKVQFDPSNRSISCSCRNFETVGILCCHALKVYDVQDMKILSEQYILKRWTKGARSGIIHDNRGNEVQEDPRREMTQRYRELCPMLIRLATEASDCLEAYSSVHKSVLELSNQVADLRLNRSQINNDGGTSTTAQTEVVARPKGFKKRDGTRKNKRLKSWVEKLRKRRRKASPHRDSQSYKTMDTQLQASSSTIALQGTTAFAAPTYVTFPQTNESELTYTELLLAPMNSPMPSLEGLEFSRDISREPTSQHAFPANAASSSKPVRETSRYVQHHEGGYIC